VHPSALYIRDTITVPEAELLRNSCLSRGVRSGELSGFGPHGRASLACMCTYMCVNIPRVRGLIYAPRLKKAGHTRAPLPLPRNPGRTVVDNYPQKGGIRKIADGTMAQSRRFAIRTRPAGSNRTKLMIPESRLASRESKITRVRIQPRPRDSCGSLRIALLSLHRPRKRPPPSPLLTVRAAALPGRSLDCPINSVVL